MPAAPESNRFHRRLSCGAVYRCCASSTGIPAFHIFAAWSAAIYWTRGCVVWLRWFPWRLRGFTPVDVPAGKESTLLEPEAGP
ncbi:MAG: hypothetical protein ACYC9V_12835 [Desulfobacteria bacterium]